MFWSCPRNWKLRKQEHSRWTTSDGLGPPTRLTRPTLCKGMSRIVRCLEWRLAHPAAKLLSGSRWRPGEAERVCHGERHEVLSETLSSYSQGHRCPGELQGGTRIQPWSLGGVVHYSPNVQFIQHSWSAVGARYAVRWVSVCVSLDKSSHVMSSSYLGTVLAQYVTSNPALFYHLHIAIGLLYSSCARVPQQSISPSTAKAVGRYAGECCQDVGSWRDLRQVL